MFSGSWCRLDHGWDNLTCVYIESIRRNKNGASKMENLTAEAREEKSPPHGAVAERPMAK